jgi:hypothetical protein
MGTEERVRNSRAAQGLPAEVTDYGALERVAEILRAANRRDGSDEQSPPAA